ncbi:Alpha/Beta hydrolase protein [Xylogone sp. PMI_703]|nr:Alpha/Beta hydrolase protein [Xylogone sp. PMI_703]
MPSVTPGQSEALSQEARDFLNKIPWFPFPTIFARLFTGPGNVPNLRSQWAKSEDPIEEAVIAKHQLHIKNTTIAGVDVLIIDPAVIKPEMKSKFMFNIHGGGFIAATARDRSALLMAAELGIRVYSVQYTLAPEAQYPIARDQCLAVYKELAISLGAENIFGMSTSAGGQIMLSLLVLIQRQKLPMMAGQVLYTPAADLSASGDSPVTNAGRDVMHPTFVAAIARKNYIGKYDTKDPLISPVFADFEAGFPPTIITTGTRDSLLSGCLRLSWKLRDVSNRVELLVTDGMWHAYHWEPEMPEAVRTRKEVYKFLASLM